MESKKVGAAEECLDSCPVLYPLLLRYILNLFMLGCELQIVNELSSSQEPFPLLLAYLAKSSLMIFIVLKPTKFFFPFLVVSSFA